MDTTQQQHIDAALDSTLSDGTLSNGEERDLKSIITELADDRSALAFVRNRAFRKARERIESSPLETLRWLERIDKLVDNTASPPERGGKSSGTEFAFSPGETGLELIRRALSSAKKTLDICVFTITDDRITSAIFDADRRGVAVRIVTDNDKQFDDGSDIARLVRGGIPTRFDPHRNHMHHKFALVDGRRLITGSYNWTRGATRNHENVTVVSDNDLIRAFAHEFDGLWDEFKNSGQSRRW